ncbi:MAG: hypothetical protein Q9162_004964 [Coniocarpon cinnabarinum]
MDPGYQMLRQATQGDVDFITGDYLAEMNLAENAEAFAAGNHLGWEPTAWDGLQQSLEAIAERNIKVIINGGAVNPRGLAEETHKLAVQKNLPLKVGYVEGDNLTAEVKDLLKKSGDLPRHLDPEGHGIQLAKNAHDYLDTQNKPLVAAHAYLGARGIVRGLEQGADIIICGRVADASPVIGAAWWWHRWRDTDYDELAGALVAGHLIECSGYVTGSNFAGFTDYPLETFVDIAYGIAEIDRDGTCVITKHEDTKGIVNEDTVLTQFLYELQGDIYLNSDVKAYISDISVQQLAPNRVKVTGIKGAPPPPTTKLAVFYKGGYESQLLFNATGYGTQEKYRLQELQIRDNLKRFGLENAFDCLEFQTIGVPALNPRTQRSSTTYFRIYAQASKEEPLLGLLKAWRDYGMQHYSGWHCSMDMRTALPRPFLAFYPALWDQDKLRETFTLIPKNGAAPKHNIDAEHPSKYEPLEKRPSYDTPAPTSFASSKTITLKLGDLCLARSGDKGANINLGIYPRRTLSNPDIAFTWLRSFLSRSKLKELLADDWKDEYAIERVEFEKVRAVHFVVYGWLGRGVSSASTLDALGKGVADYVRDKFVDVPLEVAEGAVSSIGREDVWHKL